MTGNNYLRTRLRIRQMIAKTIKYLKNRLGPKSVFKPIFLDVGMKDGGSIDFAAKKFDVPVKSAVGIDLRDHCLLEAKRNGYEALKMSATELGFKKNSFDFVVMMELLEHMKSESDVAKAIEEACRVGTKFVYIRNPNFEYTDFL